jgi:hypothetical protein
MQRLVDLHRVREVLTGLLGAPLAEQRGAGVLAGDGPSTGTTTDLPDASRSSALPRTRSSSCLPKIWAGGAGTPMLRT